MLELVRNSAADFDAVCMATALHKMASLDADPHQYQLLADRPELTRLKDMICELHPMIVASVVAVCTNVLSVRLWRSMHSMEASLQTR